MEPVTALVAGAVAGLAVAVPLGAVGLLLVDEGLQRGRRAGIPAAAGVAAVDLLYCLVALTAGAAAAPVIAAWGRWPAIVGGCVLILIGAAGLRRIWRDRSAAPAAATSPKLSGPPALTHAAGSAATGSGWARFGVFFVLTALNPTTVLYFAAVAVALPHLVTDPTSAALFVAAVGVASLAWQLGLVSAGAFIGGRSSARIRRVTRLIGSATIAGLGIALLVHGG